MLSINGALGEGGGQILRTALALSMCTQQPFTLNHIRAGRAKPGLMRQHLACVHAAAQISCAQVEGAALSSQHLVFAPQAVQAGDYAFNVGSAGSCTLVLQTIWPALMLAGAPSRIRLTGGTHNPMAPPFHFLARSYAPLLRKLGAGVELHLRRLGFYPAGGGEMEALIAPARAGLRPYDILVRGALQTAYAEGFAPGLARSIVRKELHAVQAATQWGDAQLIEGACRQNEGPGNVLLATLAHENVCEVISSFGRKGTTAEEVAAQLLQEMAAYQAHGEAGAALGAHLADQWALPLALAVWQSQTAASFTCTQLSEHTQTNCTVIAQFLPVVFTTEEWGQGWRISIAPQADKAQG